MSNKSEEEYLGTPLLEGATTLMLIGGNEIGREILIEAHRLGLESVVVSDHQYAPASHLSHRRYVVNLDDEEALQAIIRREMPEIIIQDSPSAAAEHLHSAMEDLKGTVQPNPQLASMLQDQSKALEMATQAKTIVPPFSTASSEQLIQSCDNLGYPCTIVELNPTSNMSSRLAKSKSDIEVILGGFRDSDSQPRFLARRFLPYDIRVTIYAVANNQGSETLSAPIATLGTSGSPHVSWQPLWTLDEHSRMSATPFSGYGSSLHRREEGPRTDYLWESEWNGRYIPGEIIREIEDRLRDSALKTLKRLKENTGNSFSGVIRLEFEVRLRGKESGNKPEAYLIDISPYPDETMFLTLGTMQPTIPACIVRSAAGIATPSLRSTASAVAHIIRSPKRSSWAPAYFNLDAACREDGTSIQLFGKHRFSAGEPIGMAYALDDEILKAREKALNCAHKAEEGLDLGT